MATSGEAISSEDDDRSIEESTQASAVSEESSYSAESRTKHAVVNDSYVVAGSSQNVSPYAAVALQFKGIKTLRHHHTRIFLVCDVTRLSAEDALFNILTDSESGHHPLFELRHVCCCPDACPNGTTPIHLAAATSYLSDNGAILLRTDAPHDIEDPANQQSKTSRVPRLLWLIFIINFCIIFAALTISSLCGRGGGVVTHGPYNYLPALHSSSVSLCLESGITPTGSRTITVLDYPTTSKVKPAKLPALHNCVISRKQLSIGQRLGGGLFCDTYIAHWRERRVAAKRITVGVHKAPIGLEEGKWLADQITILSRQKHRNLVHVFSICLETKEPYVLTEYIDGDSLKDLLSPHSKVLMTLTTKIKMCVQSADGMAYLHSARQPILHRDLRCANIMVNADGHAKVVDFGLTKLVQGFRKECIREECFCQKSRSALPASLRWTAPEILINATADEDNSDVFTRSCDVYSYGLVLWEVATSRDPYEDIVNENEVRELVLKGHRPPADSLTGVLLQYVNLMEICWSANPDERPTFKEVISHLKVVLQAAKSLATTRRRLGSNGSRQFLRSVRSLAGSRQHL